MIRIHVGTLIIGILFLAMAYAISIMCIGWITVSVSFILGYMINTVHQIMNDD